ncbi:NlpC/P60 family protein [Saliterribacillus persicus]|uniref:Putative peptidoglycan binding protein n=1 Tax=Saliterribacillus persicus TaxID=930114 RepID=A0A368XAH0_9BACI|nr:NlpC/P60 family protein [Saliterribacillus persicus]RCW64961.1 putative peptidoglycan binding protein [Saliterribacillus persicus]
MLATESLTSIVKHSMAYGLVLSQPFSTYVDVPPAVWEEAFEDVEELKYGAEHETVRALQYKLKKLSYYHAPIDGQYGILTEYAVKKFQKENQLPVTGNTDKSTYEQLSDEEYRKQLQIINDSLDAFKIGDTGKAVTALQEALAYFGYYQAKVDGIYGPITDKAVTIMKQDRGETALHIVNYPKEPTPQPEVKEEKTNSSQQVATKTVKNTEKKESKQPVKNQSKPLTQLTSVARNYLGIPYVWGGTSTSGFDCSGYMQYVFKQIGISLPRTVSDIWNHTQYIDSPSVGDLVFFETYKPGPSHMGIYLGNDSFIHASASKGVSISKMSQNYWKQRYLGARSVPQAS